VQATHTLQVRTACEVSLEQESLRGTVEAGSAREFAQGQIVSQPNPGVVEIKITARTNRLVDQESDIEP